MSPDSITSVRGIIRAHREDLRVRIPLLSSAEPEDPQMWNRYSYTLNNPLKYVDPLGLYVFDSSVTEEQRKQFRAGFEKAKEQLKQFKEGSEEFKKIKRALDVYGEEGVKNGVSVYTGSVPGAAVDGTRVAGVAGAKTADNPTGQDIRITFEAGQYQSSALAADVAHEGSHAADGSEWVASRFANSKNPTTYQTEFKAYTVMALVCQKLFPTSSYYLYSLLKLFPSNPNLKMPFYEYLWNSSWAEADVATLRSQNINHHLGISKKQGGTYSVSESRQGGSAFLRGSRFPR